jgi:hypothetical protein
VTWSSASSCAELSRCAGGSRGVRLAGEDHRLRCGPVKLPALEIDHAGARPGRVAAQHQSALAHPDVVARVVHGQEVKGVAEDLRFARAGDGVRNQPLDDVPQHPGIPAGIGERRKVFGSQKADRSVGGSLGGGSVERVDGVAGIKVRNRRMEALGAGQVGVEGHGREVVELRIAVVGRIGRRPGLVIPVHQVLARRLQVVDDVHRVGNGIETRPVGVDVPAVGSRVDERRLAVEVIAVERRWDDIVLPEDPRGVVNLAQKWRVGLHGISRGGRSNVGDRRRVVAVGVAARGGLAVENQDLGARPLARGVERGRASGHAAADDDQFVVPVVGKDRLASLVGVAGGRGDQHALGLEGQPPVPQPVCDVEYGREVPAPQHPQIAADRPVARSACRVRPHREGGADRGGARRNQHPVDEVPPFDRVPAVFSRHRRFPPRCRGGPGAPI